MNSAFFTQPVTPGSLVTIFGANLAAATRSSVGLPLPISLGGTSVSVNGLAAPLLYVSPSQINLQIPAGSLLGTRPPYSVQVSTSAGSGLSSPIPLVVAGPGLFTTSISGCGYAAALNVSPTGPLSVNTGSNSISPGSYVALFGTGLGTKVMSPPDGTPATAPAWVSAPVIASVGGLSAA